MMRPILAGLALVVLGSLVTGCDSKDPATQPTTDTTTKTDAAPKKDAQPKGDVAVIETNLGTIKIQLLDNIAPKTVENFEKLADQKFYDGTKFHRVIPGFMIQGGDPNSRGSDRSTMGMGGPGYSIEDEFGDTDFVRGVVAMAHSSAPNSGGSQFFINVAPYPSLNGGYTAFGKVTDGMDIADKIVNLPRDSKDNPNPENPAIIKSIRIVHPGGK